MAKKIKIETCRFVPVTSLVPKSWEGWFYEALAQSDITWGSNNRSLIDKHFFIDEANEHCSDEVTYAAWREWVKKIENLPDDVYIDMEN